MSRAASSLNREMAKIADDPTSPEGERALEKALASSKGEVVARAAKLIADHQIGGLAEALRSAYWRLVNDAKQDPGCHGKEAVLSALDSLDDGDESVFVDAAHNVQFERSKYGNRDTAAGVRARGVLGLARLGHVDLWPILGERLGDDDPGVRLAAARAVAHRGVREGAGLLILRLRARDEDPEVNSECVRGLFAIASDLGIRYARAALSSGDAEARERLLYTLGTAANDAAIELLAEELASCALSDERKPIIEAIGLSVRPRARKILLDLVSGERTSDALAALSVLSIHKYDDRLVEELRRRSEVSREVAQYFREHFLPRA